MKGTLDRLPMARLKGVKGGPRLVQLFTVFVCFYCFFVCLFVSSFATQSQPFYKIPCRFLAFV